MRVPSRLISAAFGCRSIAWFRTRRRERLDASMPRALPTWATLRDARIRKSVAGPLSLSLPHLSRRDPPTDSLDAAATDNELLRNAYKYIRDNTQLDFRTRAAAMHKLNAMPTDVRLALPFLFLPRLRLTLFWTA